MLITIEIHNRTGDLRGEWYIGLKRNLTTPRWTWINDKPLTIDKWHAVRRNPDQRDSYWLIHGEYPPGAKGSFSTIKTGIPRGWICEEETDIDQYQKK